MHTKGKKSSFILFMMLSVCSIWSQIIATEKRPVEFVILVTTYNSEKYVRRNLDSLINQRSKLPYQIIIVNDCSTDQTGKMIDEYKKEKNLCDQFLKIVHNKQRAGCALANIYNAIHQYIDDHKVVVSVDGDDGLSFNGVLGRLEKEYENPDIWMTYGRFITYPSAEFWTICGGYPESVIRARTFRQHYNVPSHLKTFKAGLFKKIKKEDLMYEGNFYKKAGDMAFMYPLLEMCAPKDEYSKNHSVYISDTVLYIYTWNNEISDGHTDRDEQIKLHRHINARPAYEPLDTF